MILNQKVLVKLDEYTEVQNSSITVPLYERAETDGGRPSVKISDKKYLSQGTVVEVSHSANVILKQDNITLSPNDRVFVNQNAVSPSYQYFTERDSLVIPFDGHVLIPITLIDKIC